MEIIVQNCFRSDRSIKNLSIHEIINTKKNIFFKFNYCLFMDENIYGINRCCLSSNFNEFSDCLRIDFVPIFQKIKKKSGFIPNYRIICNNFIKKNNINLIIIRFFNQFYELEVFETHSFQDNVNNVKIKKKIQMQEIFIHKAKYRLIDKISPINSQSEPFYGNEEFENNYIFCDLIENKKYGVFLEEYHKAYGYIITIQYNEKLFGILHVINFSNDKKYQDLELNNLISFSDLLSNSLFCMNLEEKS